MKFLYCIIIVLIIWVAVLVVRNDTLKDRVVSCECRITQLEINDKATLDLLTEMTITIMRHECAIPVQYGAILPPLPELDEMFYDKEKP